MKAPIAVVGGGHAAANLVRKLREFGVDESIVIYDKLQFPPHAKPPLSKSALETTSDLRELNLFSEQDLASLDVEILNGHSLESLESTATGIRLGLSSSQTREHRNVVISTGVKPRRIELNLNPKTPVAYLQNAADLMGLRAHLNSPKRILVIGAGFIGLEAASSLHTQGHKVSVVERSGSVMGRVLGAKSAHYFESLHRDRGVDIQLNAGLKSVEFEFGSDFSKILLDNGTQFEADLVLVAIGVEPAVDFYADNLNLEGQHIAVDFFGRTNIAGLYAMGDVAASPVNMDDLNRLKIQSIDAASVTSERVARHIAGLQVSEDYWVPRFWTEQHKSKIQMAGIKSPASTVSIRETGNPQKFLVGYFLDQKLEAIEALNMPLEFAILRKAMMAGLTPSPLDFSDPGKDFRTMQGGRWS